MEDAVVGFLALRRPDELGHLYIAAPHTGALRFYERQGFVPVEWTTGDNEEGEPDVRMVWVPGRGQ